MEDQIIMNFPKIFRRKKQASKPLEKNIVEATPVEQNSIEPLDKLPSVKEGQVTIQFTSASPANGALLVGFFVSNGLSQNVKFEKMPLVLMDSTGRVLARQSFDGETVGEIAGGSERACVVRFLPDNVYVQEVPVVCQVCFDVPSKRPESFEIQYQALPENITENQQQELERILAELPPMKHGEVNFSPLNAQMTTQSDLLITVIIRNYTDEMVNLEHMPLVVFDAHKEELARGLFEIQGLTVEAFKALVWTFDFGPIVQDKDIDLSSWSINVVQ